MGVREAAMDKRVEEKNGKSRWHAEQEKNGLRVDRRRSGREAGQG